jgi:hypothetical protein
LSLHFYSFPVILHRFYKAQLVNPKSVDVFLQTGPPIEYLRLQSDPRRRSKAGRRRGVARLRRASGQGGVWTHPQSIGGVGLASIGSGDGRRRGVRRTAAATAMPASWRFGRPMRVHRSVPGVRVEATVELGLE